MRLDAGMNAVLGELVEQSPDPVFAIRPSGRLVYGNALIREAMGLTVDDIGRVNAFDALPPDLARALRPGFDKLLVAPPGTSEIFEVTTPSGRALSIAVKSWADESGEVALVSGSGRDITVQRKQQEDLLGVQRRLLESNRDLQDFAYVASHDLQEPLRKIMAFGDRLSTKLDDSADEQALDYLRRMQNAAGRMQVLIEDLLTFSRVNTRGGETEPTDLRVVVEGVLSDLEVAIADSGARIELGELPTLTADPLQMRQLFQNLIGNALKFRRPDLAPIVRVTATRQGPSWRIVVMDNGVGFEQQYAEKIFTVFQRLHGRAEYEGSGIGLSVCRRIAERHDGHLDATSTPGQGATFTITLPAG